MSRWQEDRDVSLPPPQGHHATCETLSGPDKACNCEARVVKRIVGRKLVDQTVRVMKASNPLVEDLALATALSKVHELEWKLAEKTKDFETRDQQLTEARLETRRVEEKLAFTQRALDLHTQTCEKMLCNCEFNKGFICLVHGKANRS
jgi:hypothetical protein